MWASFEPLDLGAFTTELADRAGQCLPVSHRAGRDGMGYEVDCAGINAVFAHASRIQLIASPLLAPVLTVSGLSDFTSMHEPQD